MKVLLINPICAESIDVFLEQAKTGRVNADEPLGIAYISSWIKKKLPELEIKIFDHHILSLKMLTEIKNESDIWQKLELFLLDYLPDVVGISGLYHMNSKIFHQTAKVIKNLLPQTVIVAGGIYPTTSTNEVLSDMNIDYIVPGEGEIAFEEFLEFCQGNLDLEDLKSIAYRSNEKIVLKKTAPFVMDLDDLGYPDRSDLPIGEYSIYGRNVSERFYKRKIRVASLQPTRGCPFLCTYCSGHAITSRKHRKRTIQSVIDEIKYLKDEFNIEVVSFNDENASANPKWWILLYDEMIRQKLNIRWVHSGGFYVDLMNEELITKAIESGILMFNLAIESGSKRILNMVKKTEKIIERAPKIVDIIRKHDSNIYIIGFFLFGYPFEEFDDIKKTIDFARTLDCDWYLLNIFQPFPGCELFDYCKENGHISNESGQLDNSKLTHYLISQLTNAIVPVEYLNKTVYKANLELNFFNSRRLRIGDYKQVIRDMEHVVNIAPDHILAHINLEKALRAEGKNEEAEIEVKKIEQIRISSELQQKYLNYYTHYKIIQ